MWRSQAAGALDRPRASDIALFLHTSGTTSRPKGVPLTHVNLASSLVNIRDTYELSPADRSLLVMPLFHVHGLMAGAHRRCRQFPMVPLLAGVSIERQGGVVTVKSEGGANSYTVAFSCGLDPYPPGIRLLPIVGRYAQPIRLPGEEITLLYVEMGPTT